MRFAVLFTVLTFILFSCGTNEKKSAEKDQQAKKTEENNENNEWAEILPSIVKIDSYDGNRILESGQGFFVGEDLIVTKYSFINQATRAVLTPLNSNKKYIADKYVAVDRINDIIILKTDSLKRKPIELYTDPLPASAITSYISPNSSKIIQLFNGKYLNLTTIQGVKLFHISNRITNSITGTPIFVSNRQAIGMAISMVENFEIKSFAIPSDYIKELLTQHDKAAQPLEALRTSANKEVIAENKRIKGLILQTDMGNITIRLFNETPEYRDNFIQLTKEYFYDSLLIHRVIKNFGIQSGAADTRYAKKGDIVGYKGPGYTIPSHIVPGLFHKRGMIGSPRKPDTENERLRSDGSQFYIVSGRKYFDNELDDIEKENKYKFTEEQRQAYKTVGGAPHLDGTYTVFGEVISGMDVVDKIVQVETDRNWRPLEDVRLKKITILK